MIAVTLGVLLAALALDACLGEPRRFHPLVGFGWLAVGLEKRLNPASMGPTTAPDLVQRLLGLSALLLLILPLTALAFWLQWWLLSGGVWGLLSYSLLATLVLYWALGWQSLVAHLRAAQRAFDAGDLTGARIQVARIVSRDVSDADWPELRRAAIESGLENTSDAIVGPLFWFLVLGVPGAVLYRLSNTLDALWGYRHQRFQHFGWAAARWDDLLNLLPARLTAVAFAGAASAVQAPGGSFWGALNAWRTQARACASPNAGPVMCAGAGALGVRLGGPARYHGALLDKPWIGGAREPEGEDLARAIRLINTGLALLLLGVLMVSLMLGVVL